MQDEEKEQISTSDDLSKDMEFKGSEYKNQEGENKSTASEGELKETDENLQKPESADTFKGNEEDASDNSVAQKDTTSTSDDPTHIPTLEEDESIDKEQG
jgi:hypothetical protein